jgi:hypothetical protein
MKAFHIISSVRARNFVCTWSAYTKICLVARIFIRGMTESSMTFDCISTAIKDNFAAFIKASVFKPYGNVDKFENTVLLY